MEQLEWIRREQEGTTKYISLTEKGRALYEEIIPPSRNIPSGAVSKFKCRRTTSITTITKKLQ